MLFAFCHLKKNKHAGCTRRRSADKVVVCCLCFCYVVLGCSGPGCGNRWKKPAFVTCPRLDLEYHDLLSLFETWFLHMILHVCRVSILYHFYRYTHTKPMKLWGSDDSLDWRIQVT